MAWVLLSDTEARDFWINLLAGGVFFLLEVGLLSYLLPKILEYRERQRWKALRQKFVNRLLEAQAYPLDLLNTRFKAAGDSTKPSASQVGDWYEAHLGPQLAEHRKAMEACREATENDLAVYQRALTPEVHAAFIGWHAALQGWVSAIDSFAHFVWLWLITPSSGEDEIDRTFAALQAALANLDSASAALIAAGEVPERLARQDRPELELRPEKLLEEFHLSYVKGGLFVFKL